MERPADPAKYYTTYKITSHEDGLTREEVEALGDVGAAHDLMVASMIHTPDGGLSTMFLGRHHAGRTLMPGEYFKVWTLLTKHTINQLREDPSEPTGPGSRLDFIETVWDVVTTAITNRESD